MCREFRIKVECRGFKTLSQIWTWYGKKRDGKGNKVLHNHHDYASDTVLLLDDLNKVVGGYSFLFNDQNEITVEPVS